jgi:1-pyrroline-5-carboxylate dehydrogenase
LETTGMPASYAAENETVLDYRPGSPERAALKAEIARMAAEVHPVPLVIGGRRAAAGDHDAQLVPHHRQQTLARVARATPEHATNAIAAAADAHHDWSGMPFEDRAAIFLKAADLLAGPWRQRLNAATMLGQSKTAYQAEIDSACELIDFLRYNVQFAAEIAAGQPRSVRSARNSADYRPLEGFVYAITPFNFTAIGGNLPTAPALMGNTVVWKPSAGAAFSNYLFLELLEEAGLPPGVINFLPGDPVGITRTVLADPHFAGLHFTGSSHVFEGLWRDIGQNLGRYRNYPRLVGETGGKDFVLAHASADVEALATALLRGAYEYQGQKCSAASRAYVPRSLWPAVRDRLLADIATIQVGDVADFSTFMGAVINESAFNRIRGYLDPLAKDDNARSLTPAPVYREDGFFVPPTLVEVADPAHRLMTEEIFGPVLAVFPYEDRQWNETLALVDATSPYGLTGAVFAHDRGAIATARQALRYAAGNFYVNDKPTGAVVGQQPFGGARRSGTDDKAGSALNLLRWVSPRTIKETYLPARDYRYPSMADGP